LESARDTWARALGELQIQVNKANYNTWLRESEGVSLEANVFTISVPNIFVAEWLSKRLHSLIEKTLANILGKDVAARIQVHSQGQEQADSSICALQADGGTSSKTKRGRFNPKYTFSNFVVSDCNRLAYTAAREIAEKPGHTYNPLVIYSETGQGKTHLLHAIGQETRNKGFKAVYITAEQFTSEFVLAVRQKEVEDFRGKFRDIQTFLLDDVQFIYDKKQSLQCFLQLFKELYSNEQQIVITADCHPKDTPSLDNKLKSRLQSGLVVPMEPPDFDTRLAILRAKAEAIGVLVSEEALQTIAEKMHDNVRELEGALAYLAAQARLSGINITRQTINRLLTGNSKQRGEVMIQAAADYFDLPAEEIKSTKRDRKVVLARHIVMYLMREENNDSFTEIGKALGNRNHATALYGYEKIAGELNINPSLCQQISQIKEKINRHKI
jgi:chromosomal replication initiator protein